MRRNLVKSQAWSFKFALQSSHVMGDGFTVSVTEDSVVDGAGQALSIKASNVVNKRTSHPPFNLTIQQNKKRPGY